MISKELLAIVMDIDITIIGNINNRRWLDTIEEFRPMGSSIHEFNIHELAYKCKQWASQHGYDLVCLKLQEWECMDWYDQSTTIARGNTEPEAIFAACQWILDEQ